MSLHQFVRASAALLASTALVAAQDPPAGASAAPENLDEPNGAMLERLSSGALRSHDENGNLVDWSGGETRQSAAVALDPRTFVTVGESFGGAFNGKGNLYVGGNDPGYPFWKVTRCGGKTVFTFGPTSHIAFDVELAQLPVAHQPREADRARRVQSY